MAIATRSSRLELNQVPDFFDPRTLARVLGVGEGKAYELVRQSNFPARRVGKRIVISKSAFIRWWEQGE